MENDSKVMFFVDGQDPVSFVAKARKKNCHSNNNVYLALENVTVEIQDAQNMSLEIIILSELKAQTNH